MELNIAPIIVLIPLALVLLLVLAMLQESLLILEKALTIKFEIEAEERYKEYMKSLGQTAGDKDWGYQAYLRRCAKDGISDPKYRINPFQYGRWAFTYEQWKLFCIK